MGLNDKQRRFVDEYLVDCNATQAAIRAGYSCRTAYSLGQRLLKQPRIRQALQAARQRQAQRCQIEADEVVRRLTDIARMDPQQLEQYGGKLSDVVKALRHLGEHLGLFGSADQQRTNVPQIHIELYRGEQD